MFKSDPALDSVVEQLFKIDQQLVLTNLKGEQLNIDWTSFILYPYSERKYIYEAKYTQSTLPLPKTVCFRFNTKYI